MREGCRVGFRGGTACTLSLREMGRALKALFCVFCSR